MLFCEKHGVKNNLFIFWPILWFAVGLYTCTNVQRCIVIETNSSLTQPNAAPITIVTGKNLRIEKSNSFVILQFGKENIKTTPIPPFSFNHDYNFELNASFEILTVFLLPS